MDGLSPQDACETVLDRILELCPECAKEHLGVSAMNKKGEVGCIAVREKYSYAVWHYGEKNPEVLTIRQVGIEDSSQ